MREREHRDKQAGRQACSQADKRTNKTRRRRESVWSAKRLRKTSKDGHTVARSQ